MPDTPATIQVSTDAGWPNLRRPALERELPGLGRLWVHSYTPSQFLDFRLVACRMEGLRADKDPSPLALSLAQVACVCRTEEAGGERVFQLDFHQLPICFNRMAEHLPQPWVEAVCRESDMLGMLGYVPPKPAKGKRPADEAALRNLREALLDRSMWAALSLQYLKLYGRPLAESDEQIGEVLTMIAANDEFTAGLVGAFGALGI